MRIVSLSASLRRRQADLWLVVVCLLRDKPLAIFAASEVEHDSELNVGSMPWRKPELESLSDIEVCAISSAHEKERREETRTHALIRFVKGCAMSISTVLQCAGTHPLR